ncbi:MAG: tail protein X [Holosporaceae bacterium]|nr:tail protein X [Holosporaceae bacterium]
MVIYTTKENDIFDWIVWKHYGTTAVLEQVLAANPTLTDEKLPAGVVVKLPYIALIKSKKQEIRLWS